MLLRFVPTLLLVWWFPVTAYAQSWAGEWKGTVSVRVDKSKTSSTAAVQFTILLVDGRPMVWGSMPPSAGSLELEFGTGTVEADKLTVYAGAKEAVFQALRNGKLKYTGYIQTEGHHYADSAVLSRVPSRFSPGTYAASAFFEVAAGKRWDPAGDDPDPIVEMFVNGKVVAKCEQKNTLKSTCLSDARVSLDMNSLVTFRLTDKDAVSHDHIATIAPVWVFGAQNEPSKALALPASPGIVSSFAVFTPVQN